MNLREAIDAEDVETKISIAARHEAGHAVIAAEYAIPLRSEGIMVGQDGQGLSCYYKRPTGTDASVEANVVASFAGCYAENYFRRLEGFPERDYNMLMGSLDWFEARTIHALFTDVYRAGRLLGVVQAELEQAAQRVVAAKWREIDELAQLLLSKQWEPKKPLRSGTRWSDADMAKYVPGDEIVSFLAGHKIAATSVENCGNEPPEMQTRGLAMPSQRVD